MSEEAKFNVASGFSGGVSVSIRGTDYADFVRNATDAFGAVDGPAFAQHIFAPLLSEAKKNGVTVSVNAESAALNLIQDKLGATPVAQPGGPVAQPQTQQPAPAVPNGPSCAHGARTYKSTTGKNGLWNRWECAIPWSRDAVGRCANINA